jgi:hypothetical protein
MKRLLLVLFTVIAAHAAQAKDLPNPDFTKGEPIPEGATHDWNLGPTGARGWMHSKGGENREAKQILITKVAAGCPAEGVLAEGDVVLGVAGKNFLINPREEIGRAITAAEAKDGKLALTRWRAGKSDEVVVPLRVLGSYSATSPYDCPKSRTILDASCEALAKRMEQPGYNQNPISRSLNALGLLASGDAKYHPLLKREAQWATADTNPKGTWWHSYTMVFLSEYVLATKDTSVLPGLRRMAVEAARGQSAVGSWGHGYALPDGRLGGYGMMNSPGLVMTIGLALARDAGVQDADVTKAIERSARFLRFYIGKGPIPYGDHTPFMQVHDDNGKCGMAAVLFDQLNEKNGAEFFSKMSTASHSTERDTGHTGNFFNMTWAMPGVARAGSQATGAWMQEFGQWYFDLARSWDGSFSHQGGPSEKGDSYKNWDATGVYLIAYAMPRKAIRLTGSKPSGVAPLTAEQAQQVVADGRGFSVYYGHNANRAYDALPPDTLVELLSNWSPVARERAALALGRRKNMPIEPIVALLDAPSIESKLGACVALAQFRERAAPALPKLLELSRSKDLWLRIKAAEALAGIGKPAMVVVPEFMRKAAVGSTAEDPRGMEQRYLGDVLFHPRNGLLRNSLESVDRAALLEAVRSGLRNEDGATRSRYSSIYSKLSYEEIRPLLPIICQSVRERSPSGEMFDGGSQTAALDLLSKHHVREGIPLIAEYIREMKKHGSQLSILTFLEMLKRYGAHAQSAIPSLEKTILYFENEETDFPKSLSKQKAENVRKTIAEIKAMKDKPELKMLR